MNFYTWVLDNECLFKYEIFRPFIDNCLPDANLFNLESEKDIFYYLSVNGYSEEVLMAFLRVYYIYQNMIK